MVKQWIISLLLCQNWATLFFYWLAILSPRDLSYTIQIRIMCWTRWCLQILNRTMDGQIMVFCLCNGDRKDFSFMFRGSSCQGNFFRGDEKLHDLNHNFVVSNVVVEIFRYSEWFLYYSSLFLRLVGTNIFWLFGVKGLNISLYHGNSLIYRNNFNLL